MCHNNVLQWLQAVLTELEAFNKPILTSAGISGSVLLQWELLHKLDICRESFGFSALNKTVLTTTVTKGAKVPCLDYHICNQFLDLFQ